MLQCQVMKTWTIKTLEEMEDIAIEIGTDLINEANDKAVVLALHGNLGAGKTTLVQMLAKQMGVTETVTSPTFVIMKRYVAGKDSRELVHIDAYRIEDVDEMRVLGFESLLEQSHTIICIEWAERIGSLLPSNTKHLQIEFDADTRTITLS